MKYETCAEIELAVAHHFGERGYVIVPNVSWGMFMYELDLCALNNVSLYASEIEIKVSKSDLKRDMKKNHHHDRNDNYIKYLWFAMPYKMLGCEEFVPDNAGIMFVHDTGWCEIVRKPKANKFAKKWGIEKAFDLARLGTFRIWTLKRALLTYQQSLSGEIKDVSNE
jgi:hypothetical protein